MNPWKPWFIFRPSQVIRRLTFRPTSSVRPLEAAWGARVLAHDTDHLGQCLATTGIYDLAVSELLFRLIRPSDLVIDAGANVGYMSVLAATAGARVIAFEPNPELLPILRQNAGPNIDVRPVGLGARRYTSAFIAPDPSAQNTGLGRLGDDTARGGVVVDVEMLDDVLGGQTAAILKLDVEGAELSVLEGADRALREQRLRHIILEDHHGAGSPVMSHLLDRGYTIYSVGWTLTGPKLGDRNTPPAHAHFEAPSYLATLVPEDALKACDKRGWRALRRR